MLLIFKGRSLVLSKNFYLNLLIINAKMQNKFERKTMAYPLLGTKIVIDEEKVLREKKYKLDVIYEYLDKLAKQCDLIKIDKDTFHAKGDEKDLANLALFVCKYAVKNEWLTKNIKEWIWISENSGNEDMMAKFKKENIGVWE